MASSRPAQGQNFFKRRIKKAVASSRVRINAAPRTSNNKRKNGLG